jgi:hypothetical protein
MKMKWILGGIVLLACICMNILLTSAEEKSSQSQVLSYVGKTYDGVQDPEYISYDHALREYMVKRIHQKFGVTLDPKQYSGFELLEIESYFECKKPDEPFDLFLKMFPKKR